MQIQTDTSWYLTRLLMVLCWASWIVTFFITVTVFQAVLQIHVTAQVVQRADRGLMHFSEDFIVATPLDVTSSKKIDEMLLRYYLEMRYSVIPDLEEMTRRWEVGGVVDYLSAPSAYEAFHATVKNLAEIKNARPRVVDVLNVQRNKGERQYAVDFDLYTFDGSTNWVKTPKHVVVDFSYVRSRAMLGSELSNPRGFVVTRVDESYRGSATK